MKFGKLAVAAAISCLTLAPIGASAQGEAETASSCLHMERSAREAVDANASAANASAARDEFNQGRDACRNQYFRIGVAHFKKALSLLNVG
jgi:hypothetical protein